MRCLLEHGSNQALVNRFGHSPLALATDGRVRRLLEDAAASTGCRVDLERGEKMRRTHGSRYLSKETDVRAMIDSISLDNDRCVEELKRALEDADDFGLLSCLVDRGQRRVEQLELEQELRDGISTVHRAAPILTPSSYQSVNALGSVLRRVQRCTLENRESGIQTVLDEAKRLCDKSDSEFRLARVKEALSALKCASNDNTREMQLLDEAIIVAKGLGGDEELVSEASGISVRLSSELELQSILDQMPTVRVSRPNMTSKEAREYWQLEDTGSIDKSDEFPLLPDGCKEYVWIKSESLKALQLAMLELRNGIDKGKKVKADSDLVVEAESTLKKKTEEERMLCIKDDEDRAKSVSDAEKAAKKLLKKKKKGKKGL